MVSRNYSKTTLKVLFSFCGNRCVKPSCTNPIVRSGEFSDDVIGQISHIYAAADNGPRGKPGLTTKERNAPGNLVLLCPTCHVIVDKQYKEYPATLLLQWKQQHEREFREDVSVRMAEIGYRELEFACESLLATAAAPQNDFGNIPPEDKIIKNDLGATSANLLLMGAAKSKECEEVIRKATQLSPNFADRLRQGFVTKYEAYVADGLQADELFMAMYDWAAGDGKDKSRHTAGLCVLSHLFIVCDVFEK